MNQVRNDVLNGWKEIAAYLGRDPRTVERWEKQRSLPVRRLPGTGRATVYALVPELDEWLASGSTRDEATRFPEPSEVGPVGDSGIGVPEPSSPKVPQESRLDLPDTVSVAVSEKAMLLRTSRRRWVGPVAISVLLCLLGLGAAEWEHNRFGSQPKAPADSAGARNLETASPVPGVEELYLRGSYQAELRTPEALRRAQDAFEEAIRKDPRYAPAHAGLASVFILTREYSTLPDSEAYPRAMAAATKALALNPKLPQAHAAKGFVDFFWRWDARSADNEFKTALTLNPNLPLAHHWYGSVLLHEGQFHASLAELNQAQRLDPSSAAILTMRAFAIGLVGEREKALELLGDALNVSSSGQYRNPATMHAVLGTLCLLSPRDTQRYIGETILAADLRQDLQTAEVMRKAAQIYQARGEQAMWRALLEDERTKHEQARPTYAMARYEAELGLREEALRDLEVLFARHDSALIGISVDPLLAPLHAEPRFLRLRAAMGLPGSAM